MLDASGQASSKTGTHPNSTTTTKNETTEKHVTKEQSTNLQHKINEEKIGNIPEKEFRVVILKMIQDMGNRMEAQIEKIQEMFNKDVEKLKNKQTEMTNTITEMKNTREGVNSRITEAEGQISDLEDRKVEFTAAEQNKEKRMKRNEDSLRDLWDNIKCTNIHIIGVPEGEERERKDSKKYLKTL